MWRLVLSGRLSMGDLDKVSIDDVDKACRALDAWEAVGRD